MTVAWRNWHPVVGQTTLLNPGKRTAKTLASRLSYLITYLHQLLLSREWDEVTYRRSTQTQRPIKSSNHTVLNYQPLTTRRRYYLSLLIGRLHSWEIFQTFLRLGATLSSRLLSSRWIRFQTLGSFWACVWKVDRHFFALSRTAKKIPGFYTGRQTLFPGCRSFSAPSATQTSSSTTVSSPTFVGDKSDNAAANKHTLQNAQQVECETQSTVTAVGIFVSNSQYRLLP
jgi:hypothetical protein